MIVYKLYDENRKLLYAGISERTPLQRIKGHLASFNRQTGRYHWKDKIRYYSFAKVKNVFELKMYELFYINKLKPPYNDKLKYKCQATLDLPALSFCEIKEIDDDLMKMI